MKNKIEDLRNHLFETLEALKDKENPMPIERAEAIADIAQVIVNSAKVEVDFLKATGADGVTPFLSDDLNLTAVPNQPQLKLKKG